MDRDNLRALDEFRSTQAGPLENSLIDDYFSGGLDRGSFLRRATVLGLSATTIGAAIRAMGQAGPAFGATTAGTAGGRLRVAVIPAPTGDLEPHLFSDHGRLVTGSISGEFLTRTQQDLTLAPELAVSWQSNATGTSVDVQSAQGREVRERPADDGRRRDRDVQPPDRPECGLRGAVRLQGRSRSGRREEDQRLHDRLLSPGRERDLPVPDEQLDLPGDHPAGELQARHVRDDASDDRAVQAHHVQPRRRSDVRSQPRLVGRQVPARRGRRHLLLGQRRGRSRRCSAIRPT